MWFGLKRRNEETGDTSFEGGPVSDQDETANRSQSSWGWYKRLVIAIGLIAVGSLYPVSIVMSHEVPSQVSQSVPERVWADARIGTIIESLDFEIDENGWAATQPGWHPQSRLTAMPAFQSGMADAFSDFVGSRADLAARNGSDARDLEHARTLLRSSNQDDAKDRIVAGIEALRRFDGLKARALTADIQSERILQSDALAAIKIVESAHERLSKLASMPSRGFFNRNTVHQFYYAKGQVFAVSGFLSTVSGDEVTMPGFRSALADLQEALTRAVRPTPLTVSNPQPGEWALNGNDVMVQAHLTYEVMMALHALSDTLRKDENLLPIADASIELTEDVNHLSEQ